MKYMKFKSISIALEGLFSANSVLFITLPVNFFPIRNVSFLVQKQHPQFVSVSSLK